VTDAEAADHLHQIMVLQDRIIALESDMAHLMILCARAAEALEHIENHCYVIPRGGESVSSHTDLIAQLRKAAE